MYWKATASGVAPGNPNGSSSFMTVRSEAMGGGRVDGRGFWVMGTTSGPPLAFDACERVGLRFGDLEGLADRVVEFVFGVFPPVSLRIG